MSEKCPTDEDAEYTSAERAGIGHVSFDRTQSRIPGKIAMMREVDAGQRAFRHGDGRLKHPSSRRWSIMTHP